VQNPNTPSAADDNLSETQTAAVGVFVILPRYVLGGKGYTAPSDKVKYRPGREAGGQDRVMYRNLLQTGRRYRLPRSTDPGPLLGFESISISKVPLPAEPVQ